MSGKKPGLITGSNAKIQLGGKTLAYATDIQYSVDVAVIPVEVMGRFEVITNEPIAITVNGSFSIVRYSKSSPVPDAAVSGNGVGKFAAGSPTLGDQSSAFNPGKILSSSTVDIKIFQRKAVAGGANPTADDTNLLVTISDCRLTRLSSGLNKRGIMTESYTFVGTMYQDESFTAEATTTGTDLT